MERCDYVNDSLKLIQETDGLTFGTDALLLAAFIRGSSRWIREFPSQYCPKVMSAFIQVPPHYSFLRSCFTA